MTRLALMPDPPSAGISAVGLIIWQMPVIILCGAYGCNTPFPGVWFSAGIGGLLLLHTFVQRFFRLKAMETCRHREQGWQPEEMPMRQRMTESEIRWLNQTPWEPLRVDAS